jgi:gamma-glutamyl:cysteine ligase YbdK (ATP-grasp superfamily)
VSISGLARAEITEALTTAQIAALKEQQPQWLLRERTIRAEAQRAEARLRAERSGRRRDDPVGG